jgi:intracellular septation protein A
MTVIAGSGSLATVFGVGFSLPEPSLWAVAIAAACWLLATAATSVAIAAGRGRLSAVAWVSGLAIAGIAAFVAGPDEFARTDAAVLFGALAASLAAAVAAIAALRSAARAGTRAAPGREVESRP